MRNSDRPSNSPELLNTTRPLGSIPECRVLFPYIYLPLLSPLFASATPSIAVFSITCSLGLAALTNPKVFAAVGGLALKSLILLLPFLLIVRGAVCTQRQAELFSCLYADSIHIVLGIGLAFSVMIVAASNEWRGSLVVTINGMSLPRTARMIAIVAGAMSGEIRRASVRVHHAFAARGEASPSFRFQNIKALPRILARIWASVLYDSSERLNMQWASTKFWDRYVPQTAISFSSSFARWGDIAVILLAMVVLAGSVIAPL